MMVASAHHFLLLALLQRQRPLVMCGSARNVQAGEAWMKRVLDNTPCFTYTIQLYYPSDVLPWRRSTRQIMLVTVNKVNFTVGIYCALLFTVGPLSMLFLFTLT